MDLMALIPKIRSDKKMPEMPKEWMDVELMKGELEKAGFREVESHKVDVTMKMENLEALCDMLLKMPHIAMMTSDFSEADHAKFKTMMFEEGRKMAPRDPVELKGVSLVAVGRK